MAHRSLIGLAALVMLASNADAQTQRTDSVANGMVYGALAGGGAAFAFVTIANARCGPGCNEPDAPLTLQATLGGAAIGAAAGLVIDLARKPKPSSPALRVAPRLSAQRKGVVLRVLW